MEPSKTDLLLPSKEEVLEPVSMKDMATAPRRKQSTCSNSSGSSHSSEVSILSGGRVRMNRMKKRIPKLHKIMFGMTMLIAAVGLGLYILAHRPSHDGFFLRNPRTEPGPDDPEFDYFEHERPVLMTTADWTGFIAACFFITIAAGGGIGGGGVLVPTYIFLLKFPPKYAIPLSNCTILGSSLSNLVLNISKRHAKADRPLIDWDIMLMMEPVTIAGALVGTFVNVISPPWLVTIMLVVLLTSAAYRSLNKGMKKYKEETLAFERQASNIKMDTNPSQAEDYQALPDHKRQPSLKHTTDYVKSSMNAKSVLAWSPEEVKQWWERSLPPAAQEYIHIIDECELDGRDLLDLDFLSLSQFEVKKVLIMKILRRIKQLRTSLGISKQAASIPVRKASGTKDARTNDDLDDIPEGGADSRMEKAVKENNQGLIDILESERFHPTWKVFLMFFCTAGMLTLTILKGGGKINPLDIQVCSGGYWSLTLLAFPLVLIISYIARVHLLEVYNAKEQFQYEYLPQDVVWDQRATIRYPLICSTAGLCAGMFGIGGGIVKGPLMLEMGVYAPVTSATSATMILFTSSAASVSYLLFEQLNLHYAIRLFGLGIVFTLIGQIGLNRLVKRYKRNSLIILIIAITVALSAVLMGIESSGSLIDLFNGVAEKGKDLCADGGASGEGR